MGTPAVAGTGTGTAEVAGNVHITIPGAQAFSEFQGYHDDCGPNAELMALHVCPWDASPLSADALNSFRWQYVQAGRWGNGTTLANILWHLQGRHAHIRPGMIPYADSPNFTALHAYIKQECLNGNPIIIQVQNAQALTKNEQGVQSHFVTIAGIDSSLGYLTLNGDTLDALGGAHLIIPAQWNSWQQLLAARVCGAIALDRGATPPPPPPPPSGLPDAITGVKSALNALQGVVAILQRLQAAG